MNTLPNQKASESTNDKHDYTSSVSSDSFADSIKVRIMAGGIVSALDYPESARPLFHAAIAIVLDDMDCVRSSWRTINEKHVDGVRTRQKVFRICPRQRGAIDARLAGLIVFAAVCIALLAGGAL